jgi:hypothetical protein
MIYTLAQPSSGIRIATALAAIILSASSAVAAPERSVSANTIISQSDPSARIRLPDDVTYVGTDKFLLTKPELGEFDACELYAFASGGADGSLRKAYWVQFEHYLPKYPKMHFTYDSPRHVTIDGLDFFVDVNVTQGDGKPEPGSDGDHFYTLLARHGYKRVPMMWVRFVHLLDAAKRKELMIIVGEALPDGLTAAAVNEGGTAHARWAAMEKDFVARAAHSITITPQVQPE